MNKKSVLRMRSYSFALYTKLRFSKIIKLSIYFGRNLCSFFRNMSTYYAEIKD